MPKRFTDTDKWKKPFIRSLEGPYKLLWLYITDDCDHAGIWQVDFDVAQIRIGETVDEKKALEMFGDRVEVFNEGTKWFIKDFIAFQYGELNEKNRLHLSVINILKKNEIGPYKVLGRGQGKEQGNGQGEGTIQGQGADVVKTKLDVFEELFGDELYITDLSLTHKGKDLKQAFDECYSHHSNAPNPPTELWQWRQKLNTWLTIKKSDKPYGNGFKNKQQDNINGLIEDFGKRVIGGDS